MLRGRRCQAQQCSSDGGFTGCKKACVLCNRCLATALCDLSGTKKEALDGLICGCYRRDRESYKDIKNLAERADSANERGECDRPRTHAGYVDLVTWWIAEVSRHDKPNRSYICRDIICAEDPTTWKPVDEVEELQAQGQCFWQCDKGHHNSLLPNAKEIKEVNKKLLLLPGYYAQADGCQLPQHRLCQECLHGGKLMLVAHDHGHRCWPARTQRGHRHRHCFCFSCCQREHHVAPGGACQDPGIQQVRLTGPDYDNLFLEVGYVDRTAYLHWLQEGSAEPPPTVFNGFELDGARRQEILKMPGSERLRRFAEGVGDL